MKGLKKIESLLYDNLNRHNIEDTTISRLSEKLNKIDKVIYSDETDIVKDELHEEIKKYIEIIEDLRRLTLKEYKNNWN